MLREMQKSPCGWRIRESARIGGFVALIRFTECVTSLLSFHSFGGYFRPALDGHRNVACSSKRFGRNLYPKSHSDRERKSVHVFCSRPQFVEIIKNALPMSTSAPPDFRNSPMTRSAVTSFGPRPPGWRAVGIPEMWISVLRPLSFVFANS